MEKQRGRFIVIEGIDGAGKTTQAEMLKSYLNSLGREVVRTAEPTGYPTGIELRAALGGKIKRTECEMAVMFVQDRIAHNINSVDGIEVTLASGKDIICDRYYYSSLAYQGRCADYQWVKNMNLRCPEIRKPDICIYLDLTPEQSLDRIRRSREGVEIYETEEILAKVREGFLKVLTDLKNEDNIVIVDAYRSPEEVSADICGAVGNLFS